MKVIKKADAIVAYENLAAYCPNLAEWPKRWMYEDRDEAPGEQIVAYFTPFLQHLLGLGLSRKTLRLHRDNLWLLGGELIRDLWDTPKLRKRPMEELIASALDEEGGPLLSHHESEEEQRSFDSTCRKFHRYLQQRQGSGSQQIPGPVPRICVRKGVRGTVE